MTVMTFNTGELCSVGLATGGDVFGRGFVTFDTVILH